MPGDRPAKTWLRRLLIVAGSLVALIAVLAGIGWWMVGDDFKPVVKDTETSPDGTMQVITTEIPEGATFIHVVKTGDRPSDKSVVFRADHIVNLAVRWEGRTHVTVRADEARIFQLSNFTDIFFSPDASKFEDVSISYQVGGSGKVQL
jgi:hypothetical protein